MFVNRKEEIPDNFTRLSKFNFTINDIHFIEDVQVYFKARKPSRYSYSKRLYICQMDFEHAYLRHDFNFTSGLINMMEYKRHFKENYYLYINFENLVEPLRTKCCCEIFMRNEYFDKIVKKQTNIPGIMLNIIRHEGYSSLYQRSMYKKLDISKPKNISYEEDIFKFLKRNPYNYQKQNITWMLEHENKIDKKELKYGYKYFDWNVISYKFNDFNKEIYICKDKLFNSEKAKKFQFNIQGGVLADEVGLGKSMCISSLVKLKGGKTMILCPRRLCKQWKKEIEMSCDLKVFIVSTIVQFRKINKNKIDSEIDILLVSYSFLINNNYKKLWNTDNFTLKKYNWDRIVLDEGHEIIKSNFFSGNCPKRLHYSKIKNQIYQLKCKYKWICSGTPFMNNVIDDYKEILNYFSYDETDSNHFYHHGNVIKRKYEIGFRELKRLKKENIDILFRQNLKKDVIHEINLPEPKISSYLLKLSDVENNLYSSIEQSIHLCNVNKNVENISKFLVENPDLGNKIEREELIQVCSHILVSNKNSYILGSDNLTMEEIHKKMTSYYKNKNDVVLRSIDRYTKRVETLKKKIQEERETPLGKQITTLENFIKLLHTDVKNDIQTLNEIEKCKEKLKKLKYSNQTLLNYEEELKVSKTRLLNSKNKHLTYKSKIKIFDSLESKKEENKTCPVCLENCDEIKCKRVITNCGHIFCVSCMNSMFKHTQNIKCPLCREIVKKEDCNTIKEQSFVKKDNTNIDKWGSKTAFLVDKIKEIIPNKENKIIIFSQWYKMLNLIGDVLKEQNINYIFLKGSVHIINSKIKEFRNNDDIQVILMSSDKSVSGLTLTETNHIILLDTINNQKEKVRTIESQAIGRAVRVGQKKQVQVMRFIMNDTIEKEYFLHNKIQQDEVISI